MERYAHRLANLVQRSDACPLFLRIWLLRLCLPGISRKAVVLSGTHFLDGTIAIGDHAFVNRNCLLECAGGIVIGDHTHLAFGVSLITSTHDTGTSERRCGPVVFRPVQIGPGAWLGANVIVLPGVTIGPGAVIAAGSVVKDDIPPNCLAAGNPAVVKRQLPA